MNPWGSISVFTKRSDNVSVNLRSHSEGVAFSSGEDAIKYEIFPPSPILHLILPKAVQKQAEACQVTLVNPSSMI
jgi:hypothetical protein